MISSLSPSWRGVSASRARLRIVKLSSQATRFGLIPFPSRSARTVAPSGIVSGFPLTSTCMRLPDRLQFVEPVIGAAGVDEFLVAAGLGDLSALKDHDAVRL